MRPRAPTAFEREAEAENAARRHVSDDRQVGPADKGSAALDNLDEVDVGRRVIDLADIQRVRRVDVSGPGPEPMEMFRVRGSLLRNFLGAKQCRYSAGHRQIGWRSHAGLLAAGADLGHDRSKGWSLQLRRARATSLSGQHGSVPADCRPAWLRAAARRLPE